MSKLEIGKLLDEINIAIAQHRQEWAGMLGTSFEREDWREKQNRKAELLLMVVAA